LRLLGFVLPLMAGTALAATRVEELTVKPNPAQSAVEIAVSVERGTFDKQSCDVLVEAGDGSPAVRLTFAPGGPRTATVRHAYKKDGTYNAKAVAGYGCSGARNVSVIVGAGAEAKAAPAQPGPLGCPAGWYLVPESVQGARYSCRPNLPAQALKCEGGTSYFAEGGVIGCR